MNIGVCIGGAFFLGFLFGGAIIYLCDKAMIRHWRNEGRKSMGCLLALAEACQEVLSDAYQKKVDRAYRKILGVTK